MGFQSKRYGVLLSVLALSVPSASAQVRAGDLLLNSWDPPALRHYRTDGSLVAEATAMDTRWAGAAIDPQGRWYTGARGADGSELKIFEGDGALIQSIPIPEVRLGPGDVNLFADGTIAVCDTFDSRVELYDSTGAHLMFLSPPGMGRVIGSLVDRNDELWVCDSDAKLIWHFDNNGNLLGAIDVPTDSFLGDVDMAPDGTLWTVLYNTGEARNYATDGTLIRSFQTSISNQAAGTAVAPDGTLWVTSFAGNQLQHYDPTGMLLDSFTVPCGSWFLTIPKRLLGDPYCSPAIPNSTGLPGVMSIYGTLAADSNDLLLSARQLPPGRFGFFLGSMHMDLVQPPGSAGLLCLGMPCARFDEPGEVITGPGGLLRIDMTDIPLTPPVAAMPGDTWNFQCWYRDNNPGPTSNFTDAVSVTFN